MGRFLSGSSFFVDPLSLFFLFVIAVVSLPAAVYSLGYFKGESAPGRTALAWSLLALFVASMAAVVTAGNALVFLVAWELMSLVSYFLVIFDTADREAVRAGMIYVVMTHIGTAFLVAAFLMMYKAAASFDLAVMKEACRTMPAPARNAVFVLLLAGFGTKAGIVPLHIWLPYAHPQAPSPISAIMSGVMIKTAVYGIVRFVVFVLGVSSAWWGILVLCLAVVSCLVGVIYALMEHDLKRLLAYHSVENIGIILLGVGLAMLFMSLRMPYLAVFSMAAGLYHLINHAVFKGLLFLCSGSVYKAAGTRNIEELGGLIKKMPQTALYFLVGAMAISALPPLNGFVSEWLTLQAFFLGALGSAGATRFFLALCAAMLGLTSGLAAACFVKAFGVTFLALPRSQSAASAREVCFSMRAGMFFLALLSVLLGLAAVAVTAALAKIAGAVLGIDTAGMVFSLNAVTLAPLRGAGIHLSTPGIAAALAVLGAGAFAVTALLGRGKAPVYGTWDCGYYRIGPRNEYTATAFSKPFRIAFSFFLLPYRKTRKIRESFYHVSSFIYETHTTQVFKEYVYDPLLRLLFRAARFMRRLQPGSIHLYLAYIFVTLLALIVFRSAF
ncbi:MAG: proton-conducting transporter membrane subunit [Deltaproteobacteria bacterium]